VGFELEGLEAIIDGNHEFVKLLITDRGLDFQGDRVREGFKGRVADRNGIGPLVSPNSHDSVTD